MIEKKAFPVRKIVVSNAWNARALFEEQVILRYLQECVSLYFEEKLP